MSQGPAYVVDYLDESHELCQGAITLLNRTGSLRDCQEEHLALVAVARKYMESKGYLNFKAPTLEADDLVCDKYLMGEWVDDEPAPYHDDGTSREGESSTNTTYNTVQVYCRFDKGLFGGNLLLYPDGCTEYDGPMIDAPAACGKCAPKGAPISIDPRPTEKGLCVVCVRGDIIHDVAPLYRSRPRTYTDDDAKRVYVEIGYPCTRSNACTEDEDDDEDDPWELDQMLDHLRLSDK